MVDAGEMTEEEALHSKQAHAITPLPRPSERRAAGRRPRPVRRDPARPARRPPARLLRRPVELRRIAPDDLAALIGSSPDADALALSRHLVDFALAQGGRDNITAAVLSL